MHAELYWGVVDASPGVTMFIRTIHVGVNV